MSAPAARAPSAATRDTVRTGGLEVDRAPVTNARFAAFVEATGHRPPAWWPRGRCPERLVDHPVVGVDFPDALAFARWAGGAIPTEEEWLLASGLAEPRGFVWGPEFRASLCNTVRSGVRGTTPVGAYPGGAAPSGCVDLCGNVWEMTATTDPGDPGSIVVKGGSWYDFPVHARLETRFHMRADRGGSTIGFRLVYGRPQALPAGLAQGRRASVPAPSADAAADTDFERIVEELREEAGEVIPAIDRDLVAIALEQAGALDVFDAAERERLRQAPPPPPAPPRGKPVPRPHPAWLAHHPRAVLAALLVAILGAAFAVRDALMGDRPARAARSEAPEAVAAPAPRAPVAPPVRAARAPLPDELARAMDSLRRGDAAMREGAERWLIDHAGQAKEAVAAALRPGVAGPYQSSLRYVLEAIEERGRAWPAADAPREGLVLLLEGVDDAGAELAAVLRRTARAEGLAATLVCRGTADVRDVLDRHGAALGDIGVWADAAGELSRRWSAAGPIAVVGLRRDGGLAFVHRGKMGRAMLASRAASLARD